MVVSKIIIAGKFVTLLGMILSLIVASQYAYLGNIKEIFITGIIGLSNVIAFYTFSKDQTV